MKYFQIYVKVDWISTIAETQKDSQLTIQLCPKNFHKKETFCDKLMECSYLRLDHRKLFGLWSTIMVPAIHH